LNFFLVKGGPSRSPLGLSVAPQSASIKAGESADFVLQVASNGGLTQPVTFSCSNLPAGAQCNFSPAQLKLSQLPGSAKLTISTSAGSAVLRLPRTVRSLATLAFFESASVLLGAFAGARRSRTKRCSLALLALLLSLALYGCSGSAASTTTGGTFTVAVTSTSGRAQSTLNLSLTLQ